MLTKTQDHGDGCYWLAGGRSAKFSAATAFTMIDLILFIIRFGRRRQRTDGRPTSCTIIMTTVCNTARNVAARTAY